MLFLTGLLAAGATSADDCQTCQAGFACGAGTGILTADRRCPPGYYCLGTGVVRSQATLV